jgi:hypothetical protein
VIYCVPTSPTMANHCSVGRSPEGDTMASEEVEKSLIFNPHVIWIHGPRSIGYSANFRRTLKSRTHRLCVHGSRRTRRVVRVQIDSRPTPGFPQKRSGPRLAGGRGRVFCVSRFRRKRRSVVQRELVKLATAQLFEQLLYMQLYRSPLE